MKRNINTLIAEVTGVIRAYATDAGGGDDEHWITLSNGSRVLISGNGDILAGMGGKFSGQKIRDIKDPQEQLNERESVSNALFGEKPARKQYHRIKADFEQKERVERLRKQEEAKREKEKEEAAREKTASDFVADTIDKKSYGGYDMHKSDRELNTEAYDKYNGDEKKVKAEQLKISKQRDKYVDDNVRMFEKVGGEHGWEGTDVSRSRQSMSTYVTMQRDGYESIEIRFSDHEDRHNSNTIDLMSGNTAKENRQKLSAFLDKQKPLGAEDAKGQDSGKNIRRLIAGCHKIIRAYAADEAEEWITLKNGTHVLVGEGGEIKAGLGGEHDGENIEGLSAVSGDSVVDYIKNHNPEFSDTEKGVIENYTDDSNFVNMGLRSGNTEAYNDGYKTVEIGEDIAVLDAAFERAEPFSEEVRLHRILIDGGGWLGGLEEGDYIEDAAYTSTTADPPYKSLGDNYIAWSKDYGDESVELEILCPKGTQALYVGDLSNVPEQKEVLLPRDSKFKVVSVGQNDMGETKYVVELV